VDARRAGTTKYRLRAGIATPKITFACLLGRDAQHGRILGGRVPDDVRPSDICALRRWYQNSDEFPSIPEDILTYTHTPLQGKVRRVMRARKTYSETEYSCAHIPVSNGSFFWSMVSFILNQFVESSHRKKVRFIPEHMPESTGSPPVGVLFFFHLRDIRNIRCK